jgi:two-component system chemotaxis response regulator CheB
MGIKVLVVDDSATARAIITEILKDSPYIESVETAPDAYVARDKIVKNRPDVICLDVEMPRMDGITFLKKLMKHMPIPVIMVSSLTTKGAKTTLNALEAGAIDFVVKPHSNIYEGKSEIEEELIEKIKVAAKSKPTIRKFTNEHSNLTYKSSQLTTQKLVAIGSSTGGTEAIKEVLTKLPANSPSVIIVQHMPESFTKQFADMLNNLCKVEVKEAKSGDYLGVGQVFIAPGNKHMVLRRSGTRYYLEIGSGDKVSGHRPSVDVMFNSVAKVAGENAIGVILTGMGSDGAKGLLKLKQSGAITLGQDEKSCVVYGMPKVAYQMGAVDKEVSIENMTKAILTELEKISI